MIIEQGSEAAALPAGNSLMPTTYKRREVGGEPTITYYIFASDVKPANVDKS
jgi:hypothetical protein